MGVEELGPFRHIKRHLWMQGQSGMVVQATNQTPLKRLFVEMPLIRVHENESKKIIFYISRTLIVEIHHSSVYDRTS